MNKLQKTVIKNGVRAFLKLQAYLFTHTRLNAWGYRLNNLLAKRAIKTKKISPATTLDELGQSWQKGFPAKKEVPIMGKDDITIYGEIHTHCPLRGSGDTLACYKMMSYDRQVVAQAGGQFMVLQSQAQPGVERCKIAIRFKDAPINDLKPAHEG